MGFRSMGVLRKPSTGASAFDSIVSRFKPDKMSGRMMKYPYTFSAKVAQFPFAYYMKNQWMLKYYFIGLGLCVPVFNWIQKQACSPANVEKWSKKEHKIFFSFLYIRYDS